MTVSILIGDCRARLADLPAGSVNTCVTSPPYFGLRDYGHDGQIGLEDTPAAFVAQMVEVFREVRRVLRDDGTLWLNLGDSYAGYHGNKNAETPTSATNGWTNGTNENARTSTANRNGLKQKDLIGIPWRVAFALQEDGWYLRQDIIWSKPNPMPESVTDRCTKAHEYIFLLSKGPRYYFDAEAIKEPSSKFEKEGPRPKTQPNGLRADDAKKLGGFQMRVTETRNRRTVWTVATQPFKEAHFATFPTEIPRRAIKAGTSEKGCCPACGAPWTRIIDKTKITRERPNDFTKRDGAEGTGNSCANSVAGVSVKTIGWAPGCACDAGEPVPCLVLDPFLGSGTTVAVARELGRHGVGCELNPEYAELARERIGKAERPETYRDDTKVTDAPLFAKM